MFNTLAKFLEEITTFKGRLPRLKYVLYKIEVLGILLVLGVMAVQFLHSYGEPLPLISASIIVLFAVYTNIALTVRRLKDLDWYPLCLLLLLIPGVNAIFALILYLKKGTKGKNSYGYDPLMPIASQNKGQKRKNNKTRTH